MIRLRNGNTVYEDDVMLYADEYVRSLPNPELIYSKSATFGGLVAYVYRKMFKPPKPLEGAICKNTMLNIDDIDTLRSVWNDIYSQLCAAYAKKRTIFRFCEMTGIAVGTIKQWSNGQRRGDDHHALAKEWLAMCEADALSGVLDENSVGSIFALKSNYGYVEASHLVIDQAGGTTQIPQKTIEEIAMEYGDAAELPDIPDLD